MADGIATTPTNVVSSVARIVTRPLWTFIIPQSFSDWVILLGMFVFLLDAFRGTTTVISLSIIAFLTIFFSLYILITNQGKFINILLVLFFGVFDILLATKGVTPWFNLTIFQSQFLDRSIWPVWAVLGIVISRNEEGGKSPFTKFVIFLLIVVWAYSFFSLVQDTQAFQDVKTKVEQNIPETPQQSYLSTLLGKQIQLDESDISAAVEKCTSKNFLLVAYKYLRNYALSDQCVKAELDSIKAEKTKNAIIEAIDKKESKEKITADIYEESSDFSDKIRHTVTARIDNSGPPLTAVLDFGIGPTGLTLPNPYGFTYTYKLLTDKQVTKESPEEQKTITNIADDVFVSFNTALDKSEFTDRKKLVYSVTIKNIETTGEFTLLFMDLAQLEQLKSNYVDSNQKKVREPIKGTSSDSQYSKDQITYYKNLFTFYKVPDLISTIYPFGLIGYKENKLGAVSMDLIGKQPVIGVQKDKKYTFLLDISNLNENLKPGITNIKSLELIPPPGMEIDDSDCNLEINSLEKALKINLPCTVTVTDPTTLFNGRDPKGIFPPVPITFRAKMVFDYTLEKTIEVGPLKVET